MSDPSAAASGQPEAAWLAPGPHEPAWFNEDWLDAGRNRPVPVKVHHPRTMPKQCPVIVFSHGLGGSRAGYAYLGRHWASHGYVVLHVQHKGSDSEVWRRAKLGDFVHIMRSAARDPANVVDRPRDVTFALDQLDRLQRDRSELQGRLDGERIGMAGHSFGAYTALAVAGQTFLAPPAQERALGDPRVKAFVALSPPGPKNKERLDRMYGEIAIPGLHMTGTKDTSPIGITDVADRRIPYDHIPFRPQYLVVFRDGDHMVFSGRPRHGARAEQDERFHPLIWAATAAFWDAHLRGDPQARAWLAGGGFASLLGDNGSFEQKPAT